MSRRGVLLLVGMGVIWGVPYLLIKVAVRQISPVTLVFGRTAIGAVLLVPVAAVRRELRPVLASWRPLLAYTVAEVAVPWVLLSEAERRLPSSLPGLLVAAVPLVGAAMARLTGGHDPLGRAGLAGLALGLGGVIVLVGFDLSSADVGAAATVAVVVLGYAMGPAIVARSLQDVPGLGVVAASLLLCALGYAPFALTDLPSRVSGPEIGAVAVLGVVCTALAFLLFFALIAEVGPVRATIITYINPAVAVVLGVVFLGEAFPPAAAAGSVLILLGSVLAARRSPARQSTGAPPTGAPETTI